jgi:PmbA protein
MVDSPAAISQAESIIQAARRAGAEQAEVYHVSSEETPVKFEANRLKELNARQTAGVALRVIAGGRIGFASSTRPGDVDDIVQAAMDTAPFGPEAHFGLPAQRETADVPVFDRATEALPVDDMIAAGQRLVEAVTAVEPEIQCEAHIRRTVGTVRILNSSGADMSYRESMLTAWVFGTLIRGTDMLFVGDGDASCSPAIDNARIEAEIRAQLERCRRNAEARTAELPVVFTSLGVAEALLGPLTTAFNGRLVHQGQSPLGGLLGEQRYDRAFCLYDDGTLAMRPGARPFDDEGTPSRRVPLVEHGIVRNFLYDLQTAGIARAEPTGSAQRSLTTQPSIGTTCVTIATGDSSFDEMVRGIDEGIVVEELMGAGQGNIMGGDFSGNVLLGYKIEKGEVVGRVKNTIVAGNVHDALASIAAIGREARWVGGTIFAPPIMVDHLAVSAA